MAQKPPRGPAAEQAGDRSGEPPAAQTSERAPLSESERRWADVDELVADIFEREHDGHLDARTLDAALDQLLDAFPDALVGAHDETGVMVAMPDSVSLRRNTVLEGRSGADLVEYSPEMLESWERALATGVARYTVHPVRYPGIECTVYALDVRETHGTLIIVCVLQQPAGLEEVADLTPTPEPPPRFATMRKDIRAVITEVDEATTKILGWSAEDMVGKRGSDLMHPDDQPVAQDNWIKMLATPGPGPRLRLRHHRRDGSWVWLEVTNHNLLSDPDYKCVVCELVDISQEMAAHELLDGLAQVIPVGLLQFDADGRVAYTNGRLHEILGAPRAETVSVQLASIADSSAPALHGAIEAVLRSAVQTDLEVELHLPSSGEARFCTISLRPIGDGDTVSGAIACVADVTDNTRMREELKRRATFDELTGCYNRTSIMAMLEASMASGEDSNRAVMFVDFDGFKAINDQLGHSAGDELLSIIARRLRGTLRGADAVGRLGGDEFLAVCLDIGGPEQAMKLAERLARVQHEAAELTRGPVQVQVSIGVAFSSGEQASADELVALADKAMYESKREGAGRPYLAQGAQNGAPSAETSESVLSAAHRPRTPAA